ncbi:MAG: AAA family ATPase, partial [Nitrosomonas ureae]
MIQIETIHIEELRGIRDLKLNVIGKRFAISGPNGSGKSGVVDAVEFGLTGDISRLKGKGTADIKLSEHGPHVDKRDYPDAAKVTLEVYIPELNKRATITRKIKSPNKPIISPADSDIISVLKEVESHPEITLTRREIIKFILAEATQRSSDIQTLLKLDDITTTRSTLNSCVNKLSSSHKSLSSLVQTTVDSFRRHLDVPRLAPDEILPVINKNREILGLDPIQELKKDTNLGEGVSKAGNTSKLAFNKESAQKDLSAITKTIESGLDDTAKKALSDIVEKLIEIDEDPSLLNLIRQRSLIKTGLDLIIEPKCPLCDEEWDLQSLRIHLQTKLAKSELAEKIKQTLVENGRVVSQKIGELQELIFSITKVANLQKMEKLSLDLASWKAEITTLSRNLNSFDGILLVREQLQNFSLIPEGIAKKVDELKAKIEAIPEQSASEAANTFLTIAQDRLKSFQEARLVEVRAKKALEAAKVVYDTYCEQAEAKLQLLYDEVEQDFSRYYQQINSDDEGEFTAKLEPSQGKLGLKVDFYKKGMFPPGAYHSEGHQDGMGVCLYLALMKRVLGDRFRFAVLDDVVMSVDQVHRRQFCKLLKKEFPDTQFIITTHDKVWAQQMRSEGLVSAKTSIEFHSWSVDTGPVVATNEIWDKIQADVDANDVPSAASKLRRYLEYVSREIADSIKAEVPFKADGNYDLGGLFSPIISRQKALFSKAADSAQNWGNKAAE